VGRGACPAKEGGVRFEVWAPHCARIALRLEGPGTPREVELDATGDGVFSVHLAEVAAGADYRYRLDGAELRADPVSRHQPAGVHGPSRVVDPSDFRWTDSDWTGIPRVELVVYELHVGTFTAAGSFEAVCERLHELRELGVTALELMPVAAFPGARNWGYDGVFPYAPHHGYGGPEGLRTLVDAAHGTGLAVLLDVVYNHLGPEGNVLGDYGPYFTDRYRTPWGEALNFDGPESDEVRRFFRDNALHWIEEYHLDGLRLDAVHAIHDESARPFLGELAEAFRAEERMCGRHLHLVAESDANDPRLVREPERGGLGLDAVWNDDFHHAVHALLTGESHGYYADFSPRLALAKALGDRFVHDGGWSGFRRRSHGAPATDLPADRFVGFVQNHDQIGNRAGGERLASLVPAPKLRLAAALLLLTPQIPLLFMGEEWGETAPFLYFVDHGDPELLEAVRRGRRQEFAAFHEGSEVPDPADPESFRRSRPDPRLGLRPPGSALRALYTELLRARRELGLASSDAAEISGDAEAGWLAMRLAPEAGEPVLVLLGIGNEPARARVALGGGGWRLRLDTEDPRFGGSGCGAPTRLEDAEVEWTLPPSAAWLYRREAT
jgi:maltooligosyltrehalose trehalohydrolase